MDPFGPRNTGLAICAVEHWIGMELPENPGHSLPNVYIKKPRYPISGMRTTCSQTQNIKLSNDSANHNAFGSRTS